MRKLVFILVILSAITFLAFQASAVIFISGDTVTAAATYLLEEKYEGVGIPSGHSYVDSSGTNKVDWDDTTPTMEGSESVYVPDPGGSGQNKLNIEPGADADEMWFSVMFILADTPSAEGKFLRWSDTAGSDVVRVGISSSNNIRIVTNLGGSVSTDVCTVTPGTTYWIKLRAKKGTGANAEAEVWCTSTTTTWGTSQTSTDGTWTTQLDFVEINNFYSQNYSYNYDHLIIDTSDIPIGAY